MTNAENIAMEIHETIVFSRANTATIIDRVIANTRKACKRAYSEYYGIRDTQSACLDAMDRVRIGED